MNITQSLQCWYFLPICDCVSISSLIILISISQLFRSFTNSTVLLGSLIRFCRIRFLKTFHPCNQKPVFKKHDSNCSAQLQKLVSLDFLQFILSMEWKTKPLIRLRTCTGCYVSLLFANGINRSCHNVTFISREKGKPPGYWMRNLAFEASQRLRLSHRAPKCSNTTAICELYFHRIKLEDKRLWRSYWMKHYPKLFCVFRFQSNDISSKGKSIMTTSDIVLWQQTFLLCFSMKMRFLEIKTDNFTTTNSRLKVLPKRFKCSTLVWNNDDFNIQQSKSWRHLLCWRSAFSARDVRQTTTDCGNFLAFYCFVYYLYTIWAHFLGAKLFSPNIIPPKHAEQRPNRVEE